MKKRVGILWGKPIVEGGGYNETNENEIYLEKIDGKVALKTPTSVIDNGYITTGNPSMCPIAKKLLVFSYYASPSNSDDWCSLQHVVDLDFILLGDLGSGISPSEVDITSFPDTNIVIVPVEEEPIYEERSSRKSLRLRDLRKIATDDILVFGSDAAEDEENDTFMFRPKSGAVDLGKWPVGASFIAIYILRDKSYCNLLLKKMGAGDNNENAPVYSAVVVLGKLRENS